MNSIQGRLIAIAFFFIIGTSVTVGVVGFRLMADFEKARFRDHFSLLASYMAGNAELGVILGNKKILTGLAENMLEIDDVQVVEILGQKDKVIVKMAHKNLPMTLGLVSASVFSDTMGQGDSPFLSSEGPREVLGKVNLSFSYSGLEQLKQRLAFRFFLVSLVLAIAPAIMYWLFSKALIAPLYGLLDVAGQVSRGHMSVRARGGVLLEINTLATAFNDMLDTLELQRRKLSDANAAMARQQVLAEVGKFSMIVAHEIKNPLAIIKGSLDILKKEGAVEAQLKNRLLVFVDEEVARINKLVEDFLLFARPQTPAFRLVALNDLVDSMMQRLKLMHSAICLDLALFAVPDGKELRCDANLLERALLNVVRNAVEASTGSDEVKVRVSCSSRRLAFTVLDNGPGLSLEDRNRIFEPFYSTKAKGTGLGLAIVKEIINAHGGKISIANRKNGGSCFTVSLPLEEMG